MEIETIGQRMLALFGPNGYRWIRNRRRGRVENPETHLFENGYCILGALGMVTTGQPWGGIGREEYGLLRQAVRLVSPLSGIADFNDGCASFVPIRRVCEKMDLLERERHLLLPAGENPQADTQAMGTTKGDS